MLENTHCLTIKQKQGFSKFIVDDCHSRSYIYQVSQQRDSEELDIKRQGKYLIFAGGTGILPFIDLIAHLLLLKVAKDGGPDILKKHGKEHKLIEIEKMQLILYAAFPTSETAIGLELMKTLFDLCKKDKHPAFKVFFRFTQISNGE